MLENHPSDNTGAKIDEVTALKELLRKYRRELSHVKRDLKKAKFRIHDLKKQKEKLLQKLKPKPPRGLKSKPNFFNSTPKP